MDNTLRLALSPNYYNGIIKFDEPLSSLSVVSNSTSGNLQSFTIAYDKKSTFVLPPINMLLLNKE